MLDGSSSVKGKSAINGSRVVAIGEVMIELLTCGERDDCWKAAVAGDTFNTSWYLRAFLPETSPVSYFTALGHDHYSQSSVAPLTEKWAMWLAFTPLIFLAVDIILASAGINPNGDSPQARGAMIWSGIATIWLAHKHAKAINNAGRNPQHRTLVPFIFLFPLGYLIRRRVVAATPLTPLWIWLVSVIVYVMGAAALAGQ